VIDRRAFGGALADADADADADALRHRLRPTTGPTGPCE
jgi:hypothetical protein